MPLIDQESLQHETVMDVTAERIARVYAQAFLGVANNSGNAGELIAELQSLVTDVLDKFPEFERVLGSAFIAHEDREGMIDRVLGKQASLHVINFLKVLSAHERINCLREAIHEIARLHRVQSGQVDVKLYVARPIEDKALLEEIAAGIRRALGQEPAMATIVDPSLIAGFVIRVGDTIYDGSVKTRFEQARRAMIERAIESIETKREKLLI